MIVAFILVSVTGLVLLVHVRRALVLRQVTRRVRIERQAHERAARASASARLGQAWRWAAPHLMPWAWSWRPGRRPERGALLARRGVLSRWTRVRLNQHILITGSTGSGKSSAIIALAASARAAGHDLEFWDSKDGIEGAPYAVAGVPVVELDEQRARLAQLMNDVLPQRAAVLKARGARVWDSAMDGPELILIWDELGVSMGVLPTATVAALIKKCRAYGVRIWAGEQFGKATTIDTDIRSQFGCRISLRLGRADEARTSLGAESVAAGWKPHELPARWLLVRDPDHTRPRPARCATVPDDLLSRYPMPPREDAVEQADGPVASVAHASDLGRPEQHATGSTRTDEFAEAIERALLGGPAGVREIARATGRNPGSVHRKITQLAVRGQVEETPDGWTLPRVNEQEGLS